MWPDLRIVRLHLHYFNRIVNRFQFSTTAYYAIHLHVFRLMKLMKSSARAAVENTSTSFWGKLHPSRATWSRNRVPSSAHLTLSPKTRIGFIKIAISPERECKSKFFEICLKGSGDKTCIYGERVLHCQTISRNLLAMW